jgi:hypothetical protein
MPLFWLWHSRVSLPVLMCLCTCLPHLRFLRQGLCLHLSLMPGAMLISISWAKNVGGLRKRKNNKLYNYSVQRTYEPTLSCHLFSLIKLYWKQSLSFIYILSIATLALQLQSWVVVETRWPTKPKILTVCSFMKEVWQPLGKNRSSGVRPG